MLNIYIEIYPVLPSTNLTLKEKAGTGAPEGTVIIAEEQTMGRGRFGRQFFSPAGTGIYMSVLLRPQLEPSDSTLITTAAAVAVAEAIEEVTGETTGIKWINDIWIKRRNDNSYAKVCGILTEATLSFGSKYPDYIILGIGMAVDANVLIYERIKEELKAGKTHKAAVIDGYKNAMSAIVDSNITTVLTGIILFYFGTGPIKGFATTLIIGIITSFFTAVFVTRLVFDSMSETGRLSKWTFTTSISRNLLSNVKINWLKLRKFSYPAAIAMVILAIVSLSTLGLNQGIDFTGGRNYVIRFNEKVNTEEIAAHLQDGFKDASVSVITIGNENQVRVSTNYKITDNDKSVDDEVETILFTELQPLLEQYGVTKDMFVQGYVLENGKAIAAIDENAETLGIQSSQKVSAAIADDIKIDATLAILLSILGICLYILARFRNISYSAGALFALVHDVIFIVGAYSILYKIMPFSMEIDQSFIAAILTIVGYSVNDNVVVFDRVREMVGLYPKRDRGEVINEAVNATLIRTLSTSLSTGLVLIVILLLGGETIRGFVFAMLLGVIVGTYSTLFIAVPAAYDIYNKQQRKQLKK